MLSALVLGTMILGVLAYVMLVRPAHDGTTVACCVLTCLGALPYQRAEAAVLTRTDTQPHHAGQYFGIKTCRAAYANMQIDRFLENEGVRAGRKDSTDVLAMIRIRVQKVAQFPSRLGANVSTSRGYHRVYPQTQPPRQLPSVCSTMSGEACDSGALRLPYRYRRS